MLPDFFALGPQKTGTTWLHDRLAEHPEIFVPNVVKETFFFDRYYDRGPDWYARYFSGAPAGALRGEVGPTYFGDDLVPARIAKLNPNARLIITVRDPVKRAWSMYLHHWRKGDTRTAFATACETFPRVREDGLFARHLSNYLRYFPAKNILVVEYEEIETSPQNLLERVFSFLGVDPAFRCPGVFERSNETEEPRNRTVAKFATGTARAMHSVGLHGVVSMARSLRIRQLVYRRGRRPDMRLSPEDEAELAKFYELDMRELDRILQRPISRRWHRNPETP